MTATEKLPVRVERETAKALFVSLFVEWADGGRRPAKLWLPKSHTKIDDLGFAHIPAWLEEAKLAEIGGGRQVSFFR